MGSHAHFVRQSRILLRGTRLGCPAASAGRALMSSLATMPAGTASASSATASGSRKRPPGSSRSTVSPTGRSPNARRPGNCCCRTRRRCRRTKRSKSRSPNTMRFSAATPMCRRCACSGSRRSRGCVGSTGGPAVLGRRRRVLSRAVGHRTQRSPPGTRRRRSEDVEIALVASGVVLRRHCRRVPTTRPRTFASNRRGSPCGLRSSRRCSGETARARATSRAWPPKRSPF